MFQRVFQIFQGISGDSEGLVGAPRIDQLIVAVNVYSYRDLRRGSREFMRSFCMPGEQFGFQGISKRFWRIYGALNSRGFQGTEMIQIDLHAYQGISVRFRGSSSASRGFPKT